MSVRVVCATLGKIKPLGLQYLPAGWDIHYDESTPWSKGANNLLDEAAAAGDDILFIDDDVEFLPSTFDLIDRYFDYASMFGFSMVGPVGQLPNGQTLRGVQSSGHGMCMTPEGLALLPLDNQPMLLTCPVYLAHAGTCTAYIKHEVLAAGVRFPIWPGIHHEDIALCLDAWLAGFKVMRLPSPVLHHGAENGAGMTKGNSPAFAQMREVNLQHLQRFIVDRDIAGALQSGSILSGFQPVERS